MSAPLSGGSWRAQGIRNVVKSLGFIAFLSKSIEKHVFLYLSRAQAIQACPWQPNSHANGIQKVLKNIEFS